MSDTLIIEKGLEHLQQVMKKLERYPIFLIVEDEKADSQLISYCLNEFFTTCGILIAMTAEEALVILKSVKPDTIFVDLRLPKMDGLQLIKILRKDFQDISLVVTTILPENSEMTMSALHLGVVKVIEKPVTHEHLKQLFSL